MDKQQEMNNEEIKNEEVNNQEIVDEEVKDEEIKQEENDNVPNEQEPSEFVLSEEKQSEDAPSVEAQGEEQEEKQEDMKNIKKGIVIAVSAVFGTIVAVFAILLMAGFQFFYVLTDSMSPTILRNQMVIVNTNIDKQNLHFGDIVTFQRGAQIVTHRIVEVCYDEGGNIYYMQAPDIQYRQMLGETFNGIEEMHAEAALSPNDVIGQVATIGGEPVKLYLLASIIGMFKGAGIINFLKVALVIAIAILVIWSVVSFILNKKKKKE